MTNGEIVDRRTNVEDRRQNPPMCAQPCIPIVNELDKRDSEVHTKLDNIYTCLGTKVPSKIFWRLATGVGIIVFIGIGGTLWEMKSTISQIDTNVKVMTVTVNSTSQNLSSHITRADSKFDEFDERLDSIERGDTYFNFHNRNKGYRNSK